MDPDLQTLWQRHRGHGDLAAREQLIVHYSPLVKYVAGRLVSRMPSHVEHGELVSYGIFGLMDAIEKFDLDRGVKFESYALTRIRGAIMDELRSQDWVPRSVRRKARRIAEALATLEHQLQRSPTHDELADELAVSRGELEQMLSAVSMTSVAALDASFGVGDGEQYSLGDTLPAADITPEEHVEALAMRQLLRESIHRLSEREQKVLALYYFEGMTLAQIGKVLGVTESRVSQVHSKAVLQLRVGLQGAVAA